MTRLIACALIATTTAIHAADPFTRPCTRAVPELPIVSQEVLTHRQVVTLMEAVGLQLESRRQLIIGPDTFDLETWAKPESKLKVFILWAGWRMVGEFHFEGIPDGPARPPMTRRSGESQWVPGIRQFDLTRDQYIALMKALTLESEGKESRWNETWKKPLPDGQTLRVISEWNDQGRIRLNRIFFQGIPIR